MQLILFIVGVALGYGLARLVASAALGLALSIMPGVGLALGFAFC